MNTSSMLRVKKKNVSLFLVLSMFISVMFLTYIGQFSLRMFLYRTLLVFIIAFCLYYGAKEKQIVNPYYFFVVTPLSLLLYNERVSDYYLMELTDATWVIAIVNFLAFLFALQVFSSRRRRNRWTNIREDEYQKLLLVHCLLLFFVSKLPIFYTMVTGQHFFLRSVIIFFYYPAIACAWRYKNRLLLVSIILIQLLSYTVSFNKTSFLSFAMILLVCYIKYSEREISKWKLTIILGILSVVFVFIAFPLKGLLSTGGNISQLGELIRQNALSNYYSNRISFGTNGYFETLTLPYMYLVSAWNNLQYVMESQQWSTFGLWTLKPILGWLQLDGYFSGYYTLVPYSSFNTYTYLTVLYKDFGMWGSTVGSLFIGGFVKWVYDRYKNADSVFEISNYALVASATLEMFFSNHFFMLSYPFTIIVISFLYRLVFKSARYI